MDFHRTARADLGARSAHRCLHEAIKSIEAPDPDTVVFRLHYPSAFFLSMLAHPAGLIYAQKHLDQAIHYYTQSVMGTGPFKRISIKVPTAHACSRP